MAKIYGGRWAIVADSKRLGEGGQGEVFRVRDASGQLDGEFALKRVLNPDRRERFKREVEAIKRLTAPNGAAVHPNIISLIDHSALDEIADTDRQFLVMPIAHGGDLSSPGRLALYRDSIDAVMQVAMQLASALDAAHKATIIHRDLKPKNILFTGNGHETWLSDFGICLIREAPRITETPEVMGPRAFMAPELEEGGQLDVSPAADIYSLGKVIYYMLSGGGIVPRERLDEPQFAGLFSKGQRHQLLEMLLRRMICPLERRIPTAADVIQELKRIQDWEMNAQLLPMDEGVLATVQNLQRRSMEAARISEANRQARREEIDIQATVQTSVTAWVRAELDKVAATVGSENISCTVQDAGVGDIRIQTGNTSMYRALNGVELIFDDVNDPQNRLHVLQFFLCTHNRVTVTVTTGTGARPPAVAPARDIELAIIPIYRMRLKHQHQSLAAALGYLGKQNKIGRVRAEVQAPAPGPRRLPPRVQTHRIGRILSSFQADAAVHVAFRASEWPGNQAVVRATLEEALAQFFAQIEG